METFCNKTGLLERASQLRDEGWVVIPCDDPEKAVLGFAAFKDDSEIHLFYPFLGKILNPLYVELRDGEAFLEKACSEGAVSADNPKKLKFGVAFYEPEEGISRVFLLRLSRFKGMPQEEAEKLVKQREILRAQWRDRFSN